LVALGVRAIPMAVDVTDERACERLIRETVEQLGRLDVLVNNAGTNVRKQPETYSVDEWRAVMDTNLPSAFLCARASYPELKRVGGGKIVNIGSMMSIFGASYSA